MTIFIVVYLVFFFIILNIPGRNGSKNGKKSLQINIVYWENSFSSFINIHFNVIQQNSI